MQEQFLLYLIFATLSLLTGGMLACVWLWCGRAPYLAAWAAANFAIALARMFFAWVDHLPGTVVAMSGGAALLAAVSLLWAGGRLLRGARAPAWLVAAPALLWLALFFLPAFQASPANRLYASATAAAAISLLFAWEMLRPQRIGLARILSGLIAGMAGLYALSHLVRLLAPQNATSLAITAPNILLGGPLFIAIGFLALALAHLERAEREAEMQAQARLREAELLAASARREAEAQSNGRAEMERLHGALPAGIFHGYRKPDGSIGRLYRAGDLPAVLGWSRAELDQMETLEAISDFGGTSLPELVGGVLRQGSGSWDWRLRQPDGSWAWMRTHALSLKGEHAGSDEFVGYTFNIGREREAEARALVAARLASLGEMAAGLAHELRQPLQGISLGAEIAQIAARRIGAAALDRQLEELVAEAHEAAAMMDQLRRFARGSGDAAEARDLRLDLAVRGALAMASEALHRAGITVETVLEDPSPLIHGQEMALEQILANLVLHARDAMAGRPPDAPRHLRVETRTEHDGTALLILTDPAGGVPTTAMSRLARTEGMIRGADPATGLGISFCLGLVRAMNGTLVATHGPEGAVFTVTLPCVPAPALSA